ncbi:aldehyde dehydrogenase family protein [Dasania sp. GY-MA-18]|uniref:aldehyde dehydrogenase (NAD(+)) n=1 Tax=Dasania phycosphaerae TaxID=2950436 RepID=A0A9J6RII9_9GAMM|nr:MULTISPECIES: aldehyde dehydrogenase family protein [Dasania]MCR8921855.1 aldehyde dehydrogenase family protein [Dasania sp. GY-MA-18]MCZ0864283.1 aldehyde dehydrogenase family protein [Dasania phycosphaerae]MCZ0868011.1 aldehyde dehydrogenase family protein [Dasania phycosphaerae]
MDIGLTESNYIDGRWVSNNIEQWFTIVSPSDERPLGRLPLSNAEVVDQAVAAAKRAFPSFSQTDKATRLALLEKILTIYTRRYEEMAQAISCEMGAPISMSRNAQVAVGSGLLKSISATLASFDFVSQRDSAEIRKEPIGVAGLITPWNWPMNQIVAKVGAAIAAGCCMVLKPSEYAPYSAALFAEILDEAGVPAGVFNLVQGNYIAGAALTRHPDVDLISITGSTRAGVEVATAAAPTIKRVTQELGGKSPYVILPGSDIVSAVSHCVERCFYNSGQSCNAPTRLLVHSDDYDQVVTTAKAVADKMKVGDPADESTILGPLVNEQQFERVCHYIARGKEEGASVIVGGHPSRLAGFAKGYYVAPTIFGDVESTMSIAREEIFGPVLCILRYDTVADAVAMANDTEFGLSAYLFAKTSAEAKELAPSIRAGMVHINGAAAALDLPFGGFKKSGNGRERGIWGIEEYLEVKAVFY